jgi:hypothetical protein
MEVSDEQEALGSKTKAAGIAPSGLDALVSGT